jgi:hypothetical protein
VYFRITLKFWANLSISDGERDVYKIVAGHKFIFPAFLKTDKAF